MEVYTEVPASGRIRVTGKKPIGVRWVDISKQDEGNPKYRSRFVAKETKTDSMPESYAATPPLECLRMIITSAMTYAGEANSEPNKFLARDVSRACFYAPSIRPEYVKIVHGDYEGGDETKCGKFNVSMYGGRGAALNWQQHCCKHLGSIGFTQGKATTCAFNHADAGIKLFLHGVTMLPADLNPQSSGSPVKWRRHTNARAKY